MFARTRFFQGCDTLESIRERYKKLAKENHPDHGGDTATMQSINAEYDEVLKGFMDSAFHEWREENKGKEWFKDRPFDGVMFAEILRAITEFNVRIEIIGYWIYCFESKEYREQLKDLGFWFSNRHKAWIYNGSRKARVKSRFTTDQLRNRLGAETIRDRNRKDKEEDNPRRKAAGYLFSA